MIKILFVCRHNICRSVVAEYIFKNIVNKQGLDHQISCSSAGTIADNGKMADSNLSIINNIMDHRSRKINESDFTDNNYLIALDESVRKFLESKKNLNSSINILLLKDYADKEDNEANIKDPYDINGTIDRNLERVMFETIERCCKSFLECLESEMYY